MVAAAGGPDGNGIPIRLCAEPVVMARGGGRGQHLWCIRSQDPVARPPGRPDVLGTSCKAPIIDLQPVITCCRRRELDNLVAVVGAYRTRHKAPTGIIDSQVNVRLQRVAGIGAVGVRVPGNGRPRRLTGIDPHIVVVGEGGRICLHSMPPALVHQTKGSPHVHAARAVVITQAAVPLDVVQGRSHNDCLHDLGPRHQGAVALHQQRRLTSDHGRGVTGATAHIARPRAGGGSAVDAAADRGDLWFPYVCAGIDIAGAGIHGIAIPGQCVLVRIVAHADHVEPAGRTGDLASASSATIVFIASSHRDRPEVVAHDVIQMAVVLVKACPCGVAPTVVDDLCPHGNRPVHGR